MDESFMNGFEKVAISFRGIARGVGHVSRKITSKLRPKGNLAKARTGNLGKRLPKGNAGRVAKSNFVPPRKGMINPKIGA